VKSSKAFNAVRVTPRHSNYRHDED
jgi:hypothetical protein